MTLFGIIGEPGFGSGFAKQTIARQAEKRTRQWDLQEQQRKSLKDKIAAIGKLHLPASYKGEKEVDLPHLQSLVDKGHMSPEYLRSILASKKEGISANLLESSKALAKNWADGTIQMGSFEEEMKSGDPVRMHVAMVGINSKHAHHTRIFMPWGGPDKLLKLNMKTIRNKKVEASRADLRANKQMNFSGQLGFELGQHFKFNEKVFSNSSLGAGGKPPTIISGEVNAVEIMNTQTMYANMHMLETIESTLSRDPALKARGGERLKDLINRLVQPLTQYTASDVVQGETVTYEPASLNEILEDKNNIREVLAHKMDNNDKARAREDKINKTSNIHFEAPTHIAPQGVVHVKSKSRKLWDRKVRIRPDKDTKLVKALDINGTHAWFDTKSNLSKLHLGNGLSYKTNIELSRLMGVIKKTKRGDQANTQASQDLVNLWHEEVMGGTGDLINSMTDLYKNIIILSDLQSEHYKGIWSDKRKKMGIPSKSYYYEAAENFKKETQVEKDIRNTNKKLGELGVDLTSLLSYLVDKDPNTGVDLYFAEVEHADKMIGFRPRIEQWIAGGLEYMEELASFVFNTKDFKDKGDMRLQAALKRPDSELSATNKNALERISAKVSNLRQRWSTEDPNYKKRAIIEFKKLALTYQLSGMVQGDQTGGRTISNQDFEVMLKALWGGPQAASTARLQELLQRVKFRRAVGEMTLFTRQQGTFDRTVSGNNMVDSVLDRVQGEFKRRLDDRKLDPNSHVDIEDIGRETIVKGNVDVRSTRGLRHFRDNVLTNSFHIVMNASNIGDTEHARNVMDLIPSDVKEKYANIKLSYDIDQGIFDEMVTPKNDVVQFDIGQDAISNRDIPIARDENEVLEHIWHQTVYLPRFLSHVAYKVHNNAGGFQGDEGKYKLNEAYKVARGAFQPDKDGLVYFKALMQMSGITDKKILDNFTNNYRSILTQLYNSGKRK